MCSKCELYGGLWQMTDGGLTRCDCGGNPKLAEVDRARAHGTFRPPVLSTTAAVGIVKMFSGVMTFVPSDPVAVMALADEVRSICETNESAMWLVTRMGQLFEKWPGARAMRTVYSSKHRPLDGVEISGALPDFPDGIPSERQLKAPPMIALPPGTPVSAAGSINTTVEALVAAKSMKHTGRKTSVPDIPILPPGQRISQADIDAAVNINRDRIAREEIAPVEQENQ